MTRFLGPGKVAIPLVIKTENLETIDKAVDFSGGERNDFIIDWALYGAQEELNEKQKCMAEAEKAQTKALRESLKKIKKEIRDLTKDFVGRPSSLE